jgi:4-hydroxy-2-oxoheptanedioate aldolase
MKMRPSRILKKLRNGETVCTFKLNSESPRFAEIAAMSGFDGLWLCNEHGGNNWQTVENMIRAAKIYDVDTVVRVSRGGYSDYVRPLEMDATGIMVPHIMSAQDARNLVKMTRFHPFGLRALDGGNTDGGYCSVPQQDYLRDSNEQRFVIGQIEDPEAVEELDDIAAVPGIDILLFGPGDFSHALGAPGDFSHPKLIEARKRMVAACKEHGKFAATVGTLDNLEELLDMGFQYVNLGSDVRAVGNACENTISKFQEATSKAPSKKNGSKQKVSTKIY